MKKTVTIILTAVLVAFMAVTASCADGKWYGFAEIENAVITKGADAENPMTVTENKDASGGKLVNLVKSEGDINKRNRFTLTFNIPSDGTYAVWMRALVATSEKCDMYHTANSSILEASGKQSGVNIWRMPGVEGATAEKPVFTWYRLSVTSKSAAVELTPDGTIALKAGDNIFELSTRTGEDNLFMFDCILVTDDLSFNPQTDNWETIRDGDDGGDDTPGGDDHGDGNPATGDTIVIAVTALFSAAVMLRKKR